MNTAFDNDGVSNAIRHCDFRPVNDTEFSKNLQFSTAYSADPNIDFYSLGSFDKEFAYFRLKIIGKRYNIGRESEIFLAV